MSMAMLHVRMLSGEWVASIPAEELSDVKSLKQRLHRLHGLPTRFRQRLFHEGRLLEDVAQLDSLRDLELLLVSYHPASGASADELVIAARNGFVNEVRVPMSYFTLKPGSSLSLYEVSLYEVWVDVFELPA